MEKRFLFVNEAELRLLVIKHQKGQKKVILRSCAIGFGHLPISRQTVRERGLYCLDQCIGHRWKYELVESSEHHICKMLGAF